jgi:hypothetical protein
VHAGATFWLDLDTAEAAHPGQFIGQPLNVTALFEVSTSPSGGSGGFTGDLVVQMVPWLTVRGGARPCREIVRRDATRVRRPLQFPGSCANGAFRARSANQPVVLCVRADPEPHQPVGRIERLARGDDRRPSLTRSDRPS